MNFTKGRIFTLLEKFFSEPSGSPILLHCAGCCDVHLFTTDPKVVSKCMLAFENEIETNEQIVPAPILTITVDEHERVSSLLRKTLDFSNFGWEASLSKPGKKGEAASEQLVLRCQLRPGVDLVWNNYLRVFYVINSHLQSIHVIGDGGQSRFDVAVIHAIREWAMLWIYQGVGWTPVHSSAAYGNGNGLLFLGDKMAGKTSTLLAFLEHGGYEFVANDRVFLNKNKTSWQIIGFPYWFNIRTDTIKYFPKLRSIKVFNKTEKQVLSAFRVDKRMIADLALIFFVSFDSSLKKSRLNRLTPAEAQEKFGQNLFSQETNFLRGISVGQSNGKLKQMSQLQELCKNVPAYRLTQNIENLSSTVRLIEDLVA